jgi:hypothetical protein
MQKSEVESRHRRVVPAPRGLALAVGFVAMASVILAGSWSASGPATASASTPSDSSTVPGAVGVVLQATARTLAQRAAFTMAFAHSTPTVGSSTPKGAHGFADFTLPSGTVTLELPGGSSDREQMIFLPGTIFIKPPSSSRPLRPGRPWIFANFADIAKYKVAFPPYIVQTELVNPALVLSELAWGTTAATSSGLTSFHGSRARHYRATVNLSRALAHATGPAAAEFTQTIDAQITASGGNAFSSPVSLHIDAWIDASGRVIGARVTPPGAGIGTVTLALDNFGSEVTANKPPRAKVIDIAAMIPGGEQEALNGGDSDGA